LGSKTSTDPIDDAFIVDKIRKAGAITLATRSMDELASGIKSSRTGRTGNAYDSAQNPGGSSSGLAVSVSANFAMLGVGSDNSGSVRIPAAFNGIVGLRPSTGLISQHGIFPRGNMDGTAGPLARTVSDLASLLDVIAKQDELDPKAKSIPTRTKTIKGYKNHLIPL
jgi:amidase